MRQGSYHDLLAFLHSSRVERKNVNNPFTPRRTTVVLFIQPVAYPGDHTGEIPFSSVSNVLTLVFRTNLALLEKLG